MRLLIGIQVRNRGRDSGIFELLVGGRDPEPPGWVEGGDVWRSMNSEPWPCEHNPVPPV
jgi:hypothetical protein